MDLLSAYLAPPAADDPARAAAGVLASSLVGAAREAARRGSDAPRALHAAALASRQAVAVSRLDRGVPSAGFAAILPGSSPVEAVLTSGLTSFLSLYNAAVVGRLILTWFPNPPQAIAGPLSTVVDPYLNLFRGLLPPLGQIDLSPILAFVVLDLFSNAAAALPCEMPKDGSAGVMAARPPAGPGRAARRGVFRRRRE